MKSALCALAILFLGTQLASAEVRVVPESYEKAAAEFSKDAKNYNNEETYKNTVFAVPSNSEDHTPFKTVSYDKLDDFSKEIVKIKSGEVLLLQINKECKNWSEDLAKANRPVIGEGKEAATKRLDKASDIINGLSKLQSVRKSHAATYIKHVEKFVEDNGERSAKLNEYSTKIKKWCQKEGIELPKDLQLKPEPETESSTED